MKFDKLYADYWRTRVSSQADGTKVADSAILEVYMPLLEIKPSDEVLDIGCSYGRFHATLERYSPNISGLDISLEAIEQCRSLGYKTLKACHMEQMDLPAQSIDKAICWATFDCVEQEQALAEVNRILKPGGRVLITGKNSRYRPDDQMAFLAERNAWLKEFPNHFTDIASMDKQVLTVGLKRIAIRCFERRGDFGLNKTAPLNVLPDYFYEYLVVFEKAEEVSGIVNKLCDRFSDTAKVRSKEAGFEDVGEFFTWHKSKFPEGE